jgi:hypothetical protein
VTIPRKKTPTIVHRGHRPAWDRARTLLIQRGRHNHLHSSSLRLFTRVRVTRCWGLAALMPNFAVLYSLRFRSLPDHRVPFVSSSRPFAAANAGGVAAGGGQEPGLTQGGGGTGQHGSPRLPAPLDRGADSQPSGRAGRGDGQTVLHWQVMSSSGTPERRMGRAGHQGRSQP